MGYYSVTAEYAQKALRAGGAGPEGFQTEGYEYPVGYLVYGFDELLSKLYTIPTPSANFVLQIA